MFWFVLFFIGIYVVSGHFEDNFQGRTRQDRIMTIADMDPEKVKIFHREIDRIGKLMEDTFTNLDGKEKIICAYHVILL